MEELNVLVHKTRKESMCSDINQPDTSFYGAVIDILAETQQLDSMHASLKQVANQMSQESAATVNQVNAQIQEQKKELERLIELNDQFQQKLQEKLQGM
jgi:DNA anti-recombination protein RmuC